MKTRKLFSLAVSAPLVLTMSASAYGSSSHTLSAGKTTAKSSASKVNLSGLTLNVGDQAGTGAQALLEASGLIHKIPFKVKWDDFTSGPPILQAMASGSVEVGQVGNAPPVFSVAGGAPIAIVSALKNGNNDANIVVPKGSAIHSVSQLKGKKVAVAEGTSGNYNLLANLQHAGLNIKEVTLDYLQPADALAAFTSGSVAAWAIWSPYTEEVEVKDGARSIANASTYGNYSYNVASRSALANPVKKAAIEDLVKLLNQARVWANDHPHQWATTWGKATGLPLSITSKAAVDSNETPVPITSAVVKSEQNLATDFYNAGQIPKNPDLKNYFYSGFNSALYAKS